MKQLFCIVCNREVNLEEPGHPLFGAPLPLGDGIHPLCEHQARTWDETTAHEPWYKLFHSVEDLIFAPAISWAIDGVIQENGITAIGGLPGHGKSLIAMALAQAMLNGEKLFDHFNVARKADRVVYLCPEVAVTPLATRLRLFHLLDHVIAGRLFVRSLSMGHLSLHNTDLKEAVKGADVFLDTAIRFESGIVDENDAAQMKQLTDACFGLLNAGARTVIALHHAPKGLSGPGAIDTETVLRGSGEFAAGITGCWGIYQLDKGTNTVYLANTKARDSEPVEPFIIEGRPHLDMTAHFQMVAEPGNADAYRAARRSRATGKAEVVAQLRSEGMSQREIAKEVGLSASSVNKLINK